MAIVGIYWKEKPYKNDVIMVIMYTNISDAVLCDGWKPSQILLAL